jgi:hypothetical protein
VRDDYSATGSRTNTGITRFVRDGGTGFGSEIPRPVRITGSAALRRDDDQPISVRKREERRLTR